MQCLFPALRSALREGSNYRPEEDHHVDHVGVGSFATEVLAGMTPLARRPFPHYCTVDVPVAHGLSANFRQL
jgi:hypothetical protein